MNVPSTRLANYLAFYQGKQYEILASSLSNAKDLAIRKLAVPKSKQGLLAVEFVSYADDVTDSADTNKGAY